MSYSTPTKHDGRAVLFAVAELLVSIVNTVMSLCLATDWHNKSMSVACVRLSCGWCIKL